MSRPAAARGAGPVALALALALALGLGLAGCGSGAALRAAPPPPVPAGGGDDGQVPDPAADRPVRPVAAGSPATRSPAAGAGAAPARPARPPSPAPAGPPAVAGPPTLAAVGPGARQAVTVTVPSYGSTSGVLQGWVRSGGGWQPAFGPWPAWVGYNGVAPPGTDREGSGRTPGGVFGFSFMFGIQPNPGVRYPYRPVTASDFWDDDPSSPQYNEWVSGRAGAGADPEPMDNPPAYDYGAVIAYNTARTPGVGSAIFLHVSKGAPTAGCVSLPTGQLLTVLRWLDPAAAPVISIGTG